MNGGRRAAPAVLLSTNRYGLRRLSASRSTIGTAVWSAGGSVGESHLFSVAIRLSPVGDPLGCCGGTIASVPVVVGSDLQNYVEGASTPPQQSRRGRLGAGHHRCSFESTIISRVADLSVNLISRATAGTSVSDLGTPSGILDDLVQWPCGNRFGSWTRLRRDG